jgi:acetyl esterase/lipase
MRRCGFCVAALACALFCAVAVAQQEKSKEKKKAKGAAAKKAAFKLPDSVKLLPDLCYAQYGDRKVLLDLYLPKTPAKPAIPCIVVIHGGGWRSNDKQHFAPIAAYMAEHGLAAVSIDYRLLPEVNFPAPIEDCKAAVRWVRANAKQYGIDGEKIGCIGGSAGGHLVEMLGTSHKVAKLEGNGGNPGVSSRVQAVVSMAGPADMSGFARASGPMDKDLVALISPVTHVDADSAPTLLLHGENDNLVPMRQAELFAEKLKQAGVPVELVKVANAGHGFWNALPQHNGEMDRAVKFFEQTFNK